MQTQTIANKEIRRKIGAYGLRQWQVADALGMSEATFYRKLRTELPSEEKEKFLAIIDELGKED